MMAKEKTHLIRVFPSLKSDHKIRDEFYKALDKRIDWSTISDDAQIPTFFLINRTQTRMIDGLEEQITNHIPELSVKDQYHLFLFLQNVTPVPITANLSYKIKATYQIIWGDDTSRCLENEKMFDDLAATLIMDCGWKVKFCEHLKETYLNYGKDLELEAKIALPLSLDAKWMLNKKSVSKRAEIYQHDGFYGLKIQGVEPSDCGKYSLQIGNSEEEVEIYVKEGGQPSSHPRNADVDPTGTADGTDSSVYPPLLSESGNQGEVTDGVHPQRPEVTSGQNINPSNSTGSDLPKDSLTKEKETLEVECLRLKKKYLEMMIKKLEKENKYIFTH